MTYTAAPHGYTGLIHVPARRAGTMRVRHMRKPAGYCAPLNNIRTAIIGGQMGGSIANVHYDVPTTWHELRDEDGVWMTDLPIEQEQHYRELEPIKSGTVLIGGLGLGVALHILAPRVGPLGIQRIVVVEKSAEVIQLVEEATRKHTNLSTDVLDVVNMDLFEYLRRRPKYFDWAFYDIWRGDGENTFFNTVLPLRELSHGLIKNGVRCWNEDVMRGQLRISLVTSAEMHRAGMHPPSTLDLRCNVMPEVYSMSKFVNWAVPFFIWFRDRKPDQKLIEEAAVLYSSIYRVDDNWSVRWSEWVSQHAA